VACVWTSVAKGGRVMPDGCADIVWDGADLVVAGPATVADTSPPPPGTPVFGVRFRLGAAGAALGLPMSELRDLRVDARDVDVRFAVDPWLAPAEALAALLAAIQPVRPDRAVLAAARTFGSVAAAAREVGLSERQLRRRSLDAMGYAPQTLGRILRFQRFVRLADAAPDRSLAELALDAGFADQPHLTRECMRLAGVSPAVLRRERARPSSS
jgi:AraC-like DNA-binding protein